ncbi:MAG TPA: hypothetical protein VFD92_26305 [Candidatus Binatia bacterium]|nr:hypothetical protein [Candidatus Binatia bacterium]
MADSEKRRRGIATSASRRSLLRALGTGGAAAAALVAAGPARAATRLPLVHPPVSTQKIVYRFTTRKRRACKACRVHHRYVVASTVQALDNDRAHPGCNCPIIRQRITIGEFTRLFPTGGGIVDLRKL